MVCEIKNYYFYFPIKSIMYKSFFFSYLFLAVNHDPEFRPKITTMFEILSNCFEFFEDPSHTPLQDKKYVLPKHVPKLPDFESFNYMTLAEAAKQHRKV